MEYLRSFLRRHFAGKPVVASRNLGCFLRPNRMSNSNSCSGPRGLGTVNKELKQRRQRRQRERHKSNRLRFPKKTTLHVHHAFLYISLSRGCTTTTWNFLILRFVEDGNTRQQFSFPELWCSPLEFNPKNKRDKVWGSANSLFKWRFRTRHRSCCLKHTRVRNDLALIKKARQVDNPHMMIAYNMVFRSKPPYLGFRII